MSNTDFYVTLPSNSGMGVYPDNRPGKYKVNLDHAHDLSDGVWEVGLTEIQFTNNLRHHTPAFDLVAWVGHYQSAPDRYKARPEGYVMTEAEERLLDIGEVGFGFNHLVSVYIRVPASDWLNEYEFADALALRVKTALNKQITDLYPNSRAEVPLLTTVRYTRDRITKKANFEANSGKLIGFTTENDAVMGILGLAPRQESTRLVDAGKRVKPYMFAELSERAVGGFPPLEVMFVYSSVCEEQHIGDQSGNLLKTVAMTVEPGKRQCERYSPPTYSRLRPSTLDCIDIMLLDKTGAEVNFVDENTVVVVQLHVRKRRPVQHGWA